MTSRLAIIPARGGSKRLPRKNVIPFFGRPMLAWSVRAAQDAGIFDRIIVSTEDEEIANAARQAGAEVMGRGDDLAGDAASVSAVVRDVVGQLAHDGKQFDCLCTLYATAPLRGGDDVRKVVDLLDQGADFAMAVTSFDLPVHQALTYDDTGCSVPLFPDLVRARAADAPEIFVDNGSTYAVRTDAFLKEGSFYGSPLKTHLMPREKSVDLDTPEDLDALVAIAQRLGFAQDTGR